ncbi:MAG: phosphatidylserine decarboxylase [Gemmatimonadaceae bacterium]|nr:phosphatidylserine decarboxylase [Gemmatimonadaceae bacterium]
MNFAREGLLFIAIAAIIAAGAFAFAVSRRSWGLWLAAFLLLLIALWVAYFFRDPERVGERGPSLVVAPADGKLIMITEVDEPAFIKGRAIRLSIFMNVFNVHVNRYPVDGVVTYIHYNKGKFFNASAEKSSLENEQMSVGVEMAPPDSGRTPRVGTVHRLLVRQIAGLIARRIVTYSKLGEHVKQGERMGIIRFGSRVDLFLPVGSTIRAKLGDATTAGTTVLGELPH